MVKNVGLTYVDEFEFPAEQGFTGSAGKENVRGYYRGGRVKDPVKKAAQMKRAPGPGAAHGGKMDYGRGGRMEYKGHPMTENEEKYYKEHGSMKGYERYMTRREAGGEDTERHRSTKSTKRAAGGKMEYAEGGYAHMGGPHPEEEYPKSKAGKKMPPGVKARGGKMSMHDKLVSEGAKMGYAYGGQVKNTSKEFVQTKEAQDSMDNANYPPGHAASARDKESGPRKKLRPRFNYGGKVHQVRDMPAKRRTKSAKGMPKGVKRRGGLARYAEGGVKKQ